MLGVYCSPSILSSTSPGGQFFGLAGLVDGDLQLTGQERDFYDSLAYLLIAHEKLVTTIRYGDLLLDTVVPLSQVSFWLALLAQY